MQIAVDVNDAGRVALGGTMGPEIAQIEGTLVQRDSSEMVVAVSVVHLLRGGEQEWRGEKVRIKPAYVSTAYERQFSRGRTIAVSAAALGAVALLATRSILGAGSNGLPDPSGPPASQTRVPRP
jgi:hypothetical protein